MTLWDDTSPLDSSKLRLSAGYIRNNAAALQLVLSQTSLVGGFPYIPTTAPVWFYTNVIPLGWEAVTVPGDSLLAVVGTTVGSPYTAAGGTQVGTWAGPPVVLQPEQLPMSIPGGHSQNAGSYFYTTNTNNQIINLGGTTGLTHQHNYPDNIRPMANVGIICKKTNP